MAEWSKAVDLGSIPKGRGFKPHLLHFLLLSSHLSYLSTTIILHDGKLPKHIRVTIAVRYAISSKSRLISQLSFFKNDFVSHLIKAL